MGVEEGEAVGIGEGVGEGVGVDVGEGLGVNVGVKVGSTISSIFSLKTFGCRPPNRIAQPANDKESIIPRKKYFHKSFIAGKF